MISAKNLWVKVLFEVSQVKLKDALDNFFLSITNNKNGEGQIEVIKFHENQGNFSCIILYRFKKIIQEEPTEPIDEELYPEDEDEDEDEDDDEEDEEDKDVNDILTKMGA